MRGVRVERDRERHAERAGAQAPLDVLVIQEELLVERPDLLPGTARDAQAGAAQVITRPVDVAAEASLELELSTGEGHAERTVDARRGGSAIPGCCDERLDATPLHEQVVVEQHGMLGTVHEGPGQAGVGSAGEPAIVGQAQDHGAVARIDARAVPGLVVDQDAVRRGRDVRKASETGAGPCAGAPRDDDSSDAHGSRVYPPCNPDLAARNPRRLVALSTMKVLPVLKTGILWATRRARTLAEDQRYWLRQRALARAEKAAAADLGYVALDGAASAEHQTRVRGLQRRRELEHEFHSVRPWITGFLLDNRTYGGNFRPPEKLRVQFAQAFPGVRTILELGSLEGGHTFALAALAGVEHVVAVEGRTENVERARVVQRALGVDNVTFVVGNLETMDMAPLGHFDAIFCTGLLYHLPCPWELLARLAAVSGRIYIWTQCADEPVDGHDAGGYAGRSYDEWGRWEPLSGLSPTSFWPTREELVRMISDAGFPVVHVFGEEQVPRRGPALMLAAARRRELMSEACTPALGHEDAGSRA
jgi:hypothetical protein